MKDCRPRPGLRDLDQARDIAGAEYWDAVWRDHDRVKRRAARVLKKRTNYVDAAFLHLLFDLLSDRLADNTSILEIGCANSLWLPYLARHGGFRISGLDYSAVGCEQERELLTECGVHGTVMQGDALTPPQALERQFDLVYSYGVVEHFENTSRVIESFARFLKPNGILVTIVPNLAGINGVLMHFLNPDQFRRHMCLTPVDLSNAYEAAGLRVERSTFCLSVNLGLTNLVGLPPTSDTLLRHIALAGLMGVSRAVWAFERLRPLPSHPSVAPYIVCVARYEGRDDGRLTGEGVSGDHDD